MSCLTLAPHGSTSAPTRGDSACWKPLGAPCQLTGHNPLLPSQCLKRGKALWCVPAGLRNAWEQWEAEQRFSVLASPEAPRSRHWRGGISLQPQCPGSPTCQWSRGSALALLGASCGARPLTLTGAHKATATVSALTSLRAVLPPSSWTGAAAGVQGLPSLAYLCPGPGCCRHPRGSGRPRPRPGAWGCRR